MANIFDSAIFDSAIFDGDADMPRVETPAPYPNTGGWHTPSPNSETWTRRNLAGATFTKKNSDTTSWR